MPHKKILIVIISVIFSNYIHAFNQHRLDSLRRELQKDSAHASYRLLNEIGSEYYTLYNKKGYQLAMRYYSAALQKAKDEMNLDRVYLSYRLIAGVYDALNIKLDSSAYLYEKYKEYVFSTNKSALSKIDALRNLMIIYKKLNYSAKEEYYANELYRLLKNYNGYRHNNFKNQLAIYFFEHQMPHSAKSLCTPIAWKKLIGKDDEAVRHFYTAYYYLLKNEGKIDSAIHFLKEIIAYGLLPYDSLRIESFLLECYEANQDYKSAYDILQQKAIRLEKELKACQTMPKPEKKNLNETDKAQKSQKSEKEITNIQVLFILLMVILGFIGYRKMKRRRSTS